MRTAEEKLEFKRQLEDRTAEFAIAAFNCIDALPRKVSSKVIAFQLGKSASSIGANYRESNRAESAEDFMHKVGIVLKEASESLYWIDLLRRLYPADSAIVDLRVECEELVRIFQAIRTKMYARRKAASDD